MCEIDDLIQEFTDVREGDAHKSDRVRAERAIEAFARLRQEVETLRAQLRENEMQEELARVAPLTAGDDGQDLSRRSQPAEVTAAERTDPYFIEVDNGGCRCCCGGKTWTVVGPDGVAIGQSWEDEDVAADTAELMNQAYWAGKGEA